MARHISGVAVLQDSYAVAAVLDPSRPDAMAAAPDGGAKATRGLTAVVIEWQRRDIERDRGS